MIKFDQSDKPVHPLAGKSIHMLKVYHTIYLHPDGKICAYGADLIFGSDYILTEGEGDKMTRIFDSSGNLRIRFEVEM
jgi:hypothetical protein